MSGLTLAHKKAWEIAWTAEKEMDRCRRPRGLLLRSEQARPTRRGRELHHRMLQVPPSQTRDNNARLRVASWNVNGLHVGQEDKLTIICKIIWENKYNSYTWHNFYIIFYHAFYIVQTGFSCFSRASIHHREKECCSWIGKGNAALFTALCACMTK